MLNEQEKFVLRNLKGKLRLFHLIIGIIHFILFIFGVIIWSLKNTDLRPSITTSRIRWTSDSNTQIYIESSSSYDAAMILWIGALIISVLHFLCFCFWRFGIFNFASLSQNFGTLYNPSSRWFFYFVSSFFCYITITSFSITFDSLFFILLFTLILAQVGLFSSHEKLNVSYVILSLASSDEKDQELKCRDKNDHMREFKRLKHQFDTYSFRYWLLGACLSISINLIFLVYTFTSDNFTSQPIFISIAVCLFVFYNTWNIILSAFLHRNLTYYKHITNTIMFHTIVTSTFTTLFIITYIGLYP